MMHEGPRQFTRSRTSNAGLLIVAALGLALVAMGLVELASHGARGYGLLLTVAGIVLMSIMLTSVLRFRIIVGDDFVATRGIMRRRIEFDEVQRVSFMEGSMIISGPQARIQITNSVARQEAAMRLISERLQAAGGQIEVDGDPHMIAEYWPGDRSVES